MARPLAPPRSAPDDTPRRLSADELAVVAEAVLRGATRGLQADRGGFYSGELWLLDDASRTLGLAARWSRDGLPPATRRRTLADAPADVAALAGGAVVLESTEDARGWELHNDTARAAIGLPVASDSTLHGVLWLLAQTPRRVPDEAVELAEVVAGRLALEVERAGERASLTQLAAAPPAPDVDRLGIQEAGPSSVLLLPAVASAPPVEAAAWRAARVEGLAAAACWELVGGRLLAASAAAIDSPESSAATQRSAVEWLMMELPTAAGRIGDAGELLTVLNRRIQQSPLAGEGLAVAAALVEPAEDAAEGLGGVGTYAVAGPTVALTVRAAATDTHAGDLVPLGWTEPEAAYAPRPFELPVRGRLVLAAGDPRLTSPLVERRLGEPFRSAAADDHRRMTAEGCLRRLGDAGVDDVLAAVALRRS